MVGSILLFAALGITATVVNVETVRGPLVQTISQLIPPFGTSVAF